MVDILEIFDTNLKISGYFNSVPLEWHLVNLKGQGLVKILQPKKDFTNFRAMITKSFLLFSTLVLVTTQTVFMQLKKTDESPDIFSWLTIICLCTITSYFLLVQFKASDIAALVNGLAQFDKLHGKKPKVFGKTKFPDMISVILTYSAHITAFIVPPMFIFGLHWRNPWKPSLAGFWLIYGSTDLQNTCNSINYFLLEIITKFIVCAFNYWMWGLGLEAICFGAPLVTCLSVAIQLDNLHCFKKINGDQNMMYKKALTYRQIQVLTGLMNEILRGPFILVLIFAVIFVPAFSVATLIRSADLNAVQFITLGYISLCVVIPIFLILSNMASLNILSLEMLEELKSRQNALLSKREQNWEKRFYRSCMPLKSFISSNNFVDQLTPLHMIYLSMSLSANILLLD